MNRDQNYAWKASVLLLFEQIFVCLPWVLCLTSCSHTQEGLQGRHMPLSSTALLYLTSSQYTQDSTAATEGYNHTAVTSGSFRMEWLAKERKTLTKVCSLYFTILPAIKTSKQHKCSMKSRWVRYVFVTSSPRCHAP